MFLLLLHTEMHCYVGIWIVSMDVQYDISIAQPQKLKNKVLN